MENVNVQLIPFLRDLADAIETQKLAPQQIESIGDFFMSYQFQQQAIKDGDNSSPTTPQFSQQELVKFMSLGWYVYQVLLREDFLPTPSDVIDDQD